jgi:hypothetical protein
MAPQSETVAVLGLGDQDLTVVTRTLEDPGGTR